MTAKSPTELGLVKPSEISVQVPVVVDWINADLAAHISPRQDDAVVLLYMPTVIDHQPVTLEAIYAAVECFRRVGWHVEAVPIRRGDPITYRFKPRWE